MTAIMTSPRPNKRPHLFSTYCIAYQEILEQWSQILHDSWDHSAIRSRQETFQIRNTIEAIVRSYLIRKAEFEEVATGLGCHFVWGLQPYLGSKRRLSQDRSASISVRDNATRQKSSAYTQMCHRYTTHYPHP